MSGAYFSEKQKRVLTWWMPGSPDEKQEAILCDGAVRSGKTLAMGLGFFLWAMSCFEGESFAICGKSIGAVERNLLVQLRPWMKKLGMQWKEVRSEHLLQVRMGRTLRSTSSASRTAVAPI